MKWILTIAIMLLMAGTAQAGLQAKIGELLGLEEEPVRTEALADSPALRLEETIEPDTYITSWFLSAPDLDSNTNEYKVRVGVQNADTEFGLQLDYYGVHGSPPGQKYGAYAIVHLEQPLLTDLLGKQYLGFAATVVTEDEDIGSYGPIVGALRPITENIDFAFEYQYRVTNDDYPGFDANKFIAGMRIKF